ncbi:MAG: hypothetical protein ABFD91_18455 [Anaerohalosphaeraceae bacterium]
MFNKKPTEIESRAILNELGRVRENPNVINQLPEIYSAPSRRMAVADGVKVFYFAKNTPVATLTDNVKELGFVVSQNPATNQLILHCPDDEQADRVLDYLHRVDVLPIQVNIDCMILERFGDVTKDWASTIWIQNLFGEGITLGEKMGGTSPAFPGAELRESERGDFGLDFGYWINKGEDGHRVRMVVDALISRGYMKILMNPTLESVNGRAAKVEIRDQAPIPKKVTGKDKIPYYLTDYQWVADSLTVTPFVYADGVVGLKTTIIIGSKSKPEGVVQNAIITERSINVEENRIEPGKSLIIGGMRKSENRSVVRGVPFLKDLPIIGILFSSKDFEENATEIIFILTPSITSGGMEYSQMAASIREKQRMIEPEDSLTSVLSDPLGTDTYARYVSQEAHKAEAERIKAERQTQEAQREAQAQRQRAEQAVRDAETLKSQAQQALQQAEQAKQQIESAKTTAAQAVEQTEAERQRIQQLQQDMEKLQQEAQKTLQEAQKASEQAKEAEQKAAQLEQKAKQAQEQQEQALRQIEKIQQGDIPQPQPETPAPANPQPAPTQPEAPAPAQTSPQPAPAVPAAQPAPQPAVPTPAQTAPQPAPAVPAAQPAPQPAVPTPAQTAPQPAPAAPAAQPEQPAQTQQTPAPAPQQPAPENNPQSTPGTPAQ